MLAQVEGVSAWTVLAITVPIIVTLGGSVTALIIARLNRQSVKHEELRSLVHQSIGASRERASRVESKVEEVRGLFRNNVPLQWDSIRALEQWKAGMCVRCDRCKETESNQ